MKRALRILPGYLCWFIGCDVFGAIRYVDVNSASPSAPFLSWQSAARTIQDAIDVSAAGDEIVVTNGVYSSGGRPVYNIMTNRVAVDKAVLVRSVNGPQFTLIQGYQVPSTTNGDSAIRCAYLTNGATLVGFTLTNGATRHLGADFVHEKSGGGLWGEPQGVVSNCVFIGNRAAAYGGGAFGGTLYNCLFTQNTVTNAGGAVCSNILYNCTIAGNSGVFGGGAGPSVLNNCIVYFNSGTFSNNYFNATLNYCCTVPQPGNGSGNISADPLLVDLAAGNLRLASNSPCINAGNNAYAPTGPDFDGHQRILDSIVDIGAYEFPGSNAPIAAYIITQPTNQTVLVGNNATFSVLAGGTGTLYYQWSSNSVTIAGATNASLTLSNVQVPLSGSYYSVNVSNVTGSVTSTNAYLTVLPPSGPAIRYVKANNTNAFAPYTNWATAASTIQAAVDVSADGDEIIVTNGVYASGGQAGGGYTMNRVAANKAVNIHSVNGPLVTVILGDNGAQGNPMRCAYLTNGASLSGFTLTNGAAPSIGIQGLDQSGGGVHCEISAVVSNCVITGNHAAWNGGGAYRGTLNNCVLAGNSGYAGGGGAELSTLINCLIISNSAPAGGGGGVSDGTLTNCTIVGNSAFNDAGTSFCTMFNCIAYFNSGANYHENSVYAMNYCCTTPMPTYGAGNITNQPLFLDVAAGNCRLLTNSPCVNAGNNNYAPPGPDLDGSPRVFNGIVDMGAYESQGTNATVAPYIITPPADQTVSAGSDATFSVTAGGSPLLAYQWIFEGANLAGATNSNLLLTNVQAAQGGNYSVRITNSFGSVTSSVGKLVVTGTNVPPFITAQPANQTVYAGTNAIFKVTAGGTPPLTYRWRFNGTDMSGATSNVLVLTNVDLPNAGNYSVAITNAFGFAISSNALLSVTPVAPYISSQPTNRTVSAGASVTFYVTAGGTAPLTYNWRFNGVNINGAYSSSLALVNVQFSDAGLYSVAITNSGGFVISSNASLTVFAPSATRYVNASNSAPVSPYTNWANAATTIQDAVDIASPGDEIIVTNGTYSSGGRAVVGTMTNRVAVTKPLFIHSVNGAAVTVIQGYQLPGVTNGDGAVRCVYLTNGATLAGFTVTGGGTRTNAFYNEVSGGGIFGESTMSSTVSNCVISGNSASGQGGGVYIVNCVNCTLANNTVWANGYGGGAATSTLNRCVLIGNVAGGGGGGGVGVNLNNCLVVSNVSGAPIFGSGGGGVQGGYLNNCTIVGNTGGGVYSWYSFHQGNITYLSNCIVYYNSNGGNVSGSSWASILDHSCASEVFPGDGNITNEPLFVNLNTGDFHLQSSSPCINTGDNSIVGGPTDLDGQPRILGGVVDMGAYEFQASPAVAPLMLGLRVVHSAESDSVEIRLQGAPGSNYQLEASSDLANWVAVTQVVCTNGVMYLSAPEATNYPRRFYRARLQ